MTLRLQPGDQLVVPIGDRKWVFERVPIEHLHEWKQEHGVVPVGLMGSPKRWPPIIKYMSPTEAAAPQRQEMAPTGDNKWTIRLVDGREITLKELIEIDGRVEAYGKDVHIGHLKVIALERNKRLEPLSTSRKLSEDYQLIGLCGERRFSEITGMPMSVHIKKMTGDGGVDFPTSVGTIDVKTYAKPYNMLREVGKAPEKCADILVLGRYLGPFTYPWAEMIAWEWDTVMVKQPTKMFMLLNHKKPAKDCQRMEALYRMLVEAGDVPAGVLAEAGVSW